MRPEQILHPEHRRSGGEVLQGVTSVFLLAAPISSSTQWSDAKQNFFFFLHNGSSINSLGAPCLQKPNSQHALLLSMSPKVLPKKRSKNFLVIYFLYLNYGSTFQFNEVITPPSFSIWSDEFPKQHNPRPIWGMSCCRGEEVKILSFGFAEVAIFTSTKSEEKKVTLGFGEVKKWS